MARVSKNQRVHEKQDQKAQTCSNNHPRTRVKVVPGFKGRTYMAWQCECGVLR
jgi:hypothetical protein